MEDVRLHGGRESAAAAAGLGARAFAVGRDIHLGKEMSRRPFEPESRFALLHEVAHVGQQRGARFAGDGSGAATAAHESEASQVAASLTWGQLEAEYPRVSAASGPGPAAAASPRSPVLRLNRVAPQLVELTYDDGPDKAGKTREILNHLNKAGAKATFYVVGRRVIEGDNWKVVFDIAASGHWLGNHAFDWNMAKDNHLFLSGPPMERARKILITELAIQDALRKGKAAAQKAKKWSSIPKANRDYIDDVIAKGTGRFRTPGFRSKWWRADGRKTQSAIVIVNQILEGLGLREMEVSDSVDIDPKDWKKGRTKAEVEKGVIDELDDSDDSILLHSRLGISADATPAILKAIKKKGWKYTAPARGTAGVYRPGKGFAGLKSTSKVPTKAEIDKAKAFMLKNLSFGPVLMGTTAIGIFKLTYLAGGTATADFMKWLETTPGPPGTGYLTNFLYQWSQFRLFYEFAKHWRSGKPFPKGPGVKY